MRTIRLLAALIAASVLAAGCGSIIERDLDRQAVQLDGADAQGGLAFDDSTLDAGAGAGPGAAPGGAEGSGAGPITGSDAEAGAATGEGGASSGGGGGASTGTGAGGSGTQGQRASGGGGAGNDGSKIKLGYVVMDTTGADALLGSNSIGERDKGAARREMEALIGWANDNGGVGGRKIDGQAFVVQATSQQEERMAKCVEMTEDHGIEVLIDVQIFIHEQTQACFAQHRTTLAAIVTGTDRQFLHQLRPYVMTTWATLDRQAEALADGLEAAGYFKNAKVGVLLSDEPTVARVYQQKFLPALRRRGVKVEDVARMSTDPGPMQAQASNAVLRFRGAGITHVVMFLNVLQYLAFTNQAESQNYRPRYGIGDFQAGTGVAAFYGSPSQNRNALGISVAHYLIPDDNSRSSTDVSSPLDPDRLTPGHRRCLDILSKRTGRNYYKPGEAGSSGFEIFYCDHFMLWLQAARKTGAGVTPDTLGQGLGALGDSYLPSVANANRWTSGRADGASTYRVGKYDSQCRCFVGVTPWRPLPG